MINDLSIFINEKNKISYFKCINDIATELTEITSKINSNVNSVFECAKNNVKIVNDAKKTTEQILGILESTQENFSLARLNFMNSYHLWLSNVLSDNQAKSDSIATNVTCNLDTNQNETIIDLEDPNVSEVQIIEDPDIQIVNEIRYLNHRKSSHSYDSVQKDKQPDASKKQSSDFDICNVFVQDNHDISSCLMDDSFESIADNIEQFDTREVYRHSPKLDSSRNDETQENLNIVCNQKNNLNKTELSSVNQDYVISKGDQIEEITDVPSKNFGTYHSKSNDNEDYIILIKEEIEQITDIPLTSLRLKPTAYSDEKLQLRCFVQLDGLNDTNLKTFRSHERRSQRTLGDDAFLRLIDLSGLEKRTNKRCHSSSDDSCSSTSGRSSYSVTKRKVKRQKICSDESDVTSFYESTDSDADDYLKNKNEKFDQQIFEKLDENEKNAKLLLLDGSDTSDDSDVPTDNEEDQCDNSEKKRNSTKTKSLDSKNSDKKKSSRSAWQDDDLLKFKLPNDKNHEKRSLKDVNDFESASGNDIEITEPESIESLPSTNSEENDPKDEDNEDMNNDLQTSISIATPHSKIAGRRNIRKVLDDQDITEITRLAVKDEENRLQRLAERKKPLNSLAKELLGPDKSFNEDSLTLDFDFETKKILVEVDRRLVRLLKAHQKEGVRFMWDCCFESVAEVKRQRGSGCILAHCMGLGKTLQVITLAHTLLSNEAIGIKSIMIVCPMNTILNWVDEFDTWLGRESNINIFELTQSKQISTRISKLEDWQKNGGVLIISYDMLGSWTSSKKFTPMQLKKLNSLLINPGADVVVCDEGHLLKNEKSKRAARMQSVYTKRRIILTGTPLQNNLNEYHCMLEFVKPHLLGSKAEFLNRFGNPINNGQFGNSTPHDVKLMKHRAHVLHGLLQGCVQRCNYAVLKPLLPQKQEYVITVRLSVLQREMYQHFISHVAQISTKQSCLFKNYQVIKRLVAHPKTMQLKMQRRKQPNVKGARVPDQAADSNETDDWWCDWVEEEDLEDKSISFKLVLLFGLLESCAKKLDKVLIFSQCLLTLDLIEHFLKEPNGQWERGFDYFRLDGAVDSNERSKMCKEFNDPTNDRARLFLISTRAGGLGINLTGANRVVVFDPSWNPSNDLQSIFRVFRFGQKKPCYVYRFLTAGTMEEKIYIRQVTKLSLSLRVLDEQQVERHYRDSDLRDLYQLETLSEKAPGLDQPKDDLLAEVFAKYGECVYKCIEHDSLLENQEEEELDEEERKQAWLDYHQENLAHEPSNDATTTKPKTNKRKMLSESSVDSNMVSDTTAAPIVEITDLSD